MEFSIYDPDNFFESLSAIPEDENVDCVIMQVPPNLFDFISSSPDIGEEEANAVLDQFTNRFLNMRRPGKTVALWRASMGPMEQKWMERIEANGLPVFESAERAIRAIGAMNRYRSKRREEVD
jgi:acyl-CoA synthetase (NDP forming)